MAVSQVRHIADPGQFFALNSVSDLVDNSLGADQIR
ncbi:unannotated protein [freshwater metagenome]|uniref:Unannotated protein n=1 Tax=freshwater metagenome TaxID=449393 RepID=A0A6J6KI38_9ZZZZ